MEFVEENFSYGPFVVERGVSILWECEFGETILFTMEETTLNFKKSTISQR